MQKENNSIENKDESNAKQHIEEIQNNAEIERQKALMLKINKVNNIQMLKTLRNDGDINGDRN